MKVAIVASHFYPSVGGVEKYTLHIARLLKAAGWSVVVITTGGTSFGSPVNFEGIKLYRLRSALTVSNTPVGYRWRRQLAEIFRIEAPDIINAHTPVPYLADMAQRASGSTPFVLTYHNDLAKDFLPSKIASHLMHLALIDRTLRESSRIIATSEYYVNASPYLAPYKAKVEIVPPGVDMAQVNPDVAVGAKLAARFADKRVVLFVGSVNRTQRHKGLDVLLRAFAAINRESPDTRLVVVGRGDAIRLYEALAAATGVEDAVEFTGYVDESELAQYYRLATVFVMPSTNNSEGFGMVYIEAGAAGTPVVGSRVGGVPYAVRDNETGLLAEPRSVDSLRSAIRAILDDPELARKLGEAGSCRAAREFDWRVLAERTSRILTRVAQRNAGSPAG